MSAAAAAPAAAGAPAPAAPVSTAAAEDFVRFVNASPSPYHACASVCERLVAAGFTKLSEKELWEVKPGGKYFVVRNQSAVIAFAVGGKWTPGQGFTLAAAHTDSPCMRVKPVSTVSKAGYASVGVEMYGGLLHATWVDRDLSVAGRAIVARPGGGFESRLVAVRKPILRIPTLAIHLQRDVNSEGMKLNAETHLVPVLATAVKAALEAPGPRSAADGADAASRHHSGLVRVVAEEMGVRPEDVRDFDLALYDTQPAAIGGLYNEFIFSARLDNLMMTYCSIMGLINSVAEDSTNPLADDTNVRIAAAFDHEECGSASVPGAGSTFLEDALARLVPDRAEFAVSIRKSILVSADMAHAVHPNYSHLHEENHRPAIHGGIVIKCNANQRYATTTITSFIFRQIARDLGVPVQQFVVRQDMGCGSTIGPIVAERLGMRTVDVGLPQLSMHSCREMCGTDDVAHGLKFLSNFWGRFPALDASIEGAE